MKKKIFFLFISFAFVYPNDKVEVYFESINNAELAIVNQEFSNAHAQYKKAFGSHTPFSYDIHNAILVAQELNDFKTAIIYSKILFQRDITSNFFNQSKFSKLIQSHLWKKMMLSDFDSNNEYIKTTFNKKLRKKIEILIEMDQKFRINSNRDSLIIYDSLIRQETNLLLDKYGFLSEAKTGVWQRNDTTLSFSHPIDVILLHQVKNGHKELFTKLKYFVKTGQMHPLKLAELGYWSDDKSLQFGCSDINQTVFYQINDELYTCNDERVEKINDNRKQYFLESLEDLKKKIFFYYFRDKRFKLNISYSTPYLTTQNEETKRYYIKLGLKLMKKLPNNDAYFKQ